MANRRTYIWTSITAAVAVMLGGSWAGSLLVPENYPVRPGYNVPGMTEPPVDLASLQRSWPAGMAQPGGELRLIGYMTKVEHGAIQPPPVDQAALVAKPVEQVDLGTLLAHSDVERGRGAARVCGSCHTLDSGGPNRTGPNLWGLVGRPIARHGGFAYSPALTSQDGSWTYERLDKFLASPARTVPGTKMAFGGVRNPTDRANLLAFLGSLNSAPAPFPAPKPIPSAEDQSATR
jgi:cytochrome c